ncbi:hypothetical protein BDN71DRAFT_1512274 [Pleurotus eryngii]|uniref:Uncharacterized protein n=1 Tax=Pleurotus eryngii TaxID=5323 RepID=A0A9P6D347_PLEER|nr:hypothetical protein BDN71DRAFT_1512274 [Pleurotus eryngii]
MLQFLSPLFPTTSARHISLNDASRPVREHADNAGPSETMVKPQASTSNTPVPPPYSSTTPVFVSPSPRHPLPSTMTTREPPLSSPLPPYDHLLGHHHVPPPSKNVDAATVYVQGHSTIVSHPVPPLKHSPLRTIDDIVTISRRITK